MPDRVDVKVWRVWRADLSESISVSATSEQEAIRKANGTHRTYAPQEQSFTSAEEIAGSIAEHIADAIASFEIAAARLAILKKNPASDKSAYWRVVDEFEQACERTRESLMVL